MLLVLALFLVGPASGKVYERCELARELRDVHEAASHQLATWVCIAEHESQYNTSAVGHLSGDGSGDHGIFQISDLYWCSPPGKGWACGLSCSQLTDEDIEDDFVCARRIYREHKRLSGDGFNAWAVYQPYCRGDVQSYTKGCFEDKASTEKSLPSSTASTSTLSTTRSNGKSMKSTRHRFIFNGVEWF